MDKKGKLKPPGEDYAKPARDALQKKYPYLSDEALEYYE